MVIPPQSVRLFLLALLCTLSVYTAAGKTPLFLFDNSLNIPRLASYRSPGGIDNHINKTNIGFIGKPPANTSAPPLARTQTIVDMLSLPAPKNLRRGINSGNLKFQPSAPQKSGVSQEEKMFTRVLALFNGRNRSHRPQAHCHKTQSSNSNFNTIGNRDGNYRSYTGAEGFPPFCSGVILAASFHTLDGMHDGTVIRNTLYKFQLDPLSGKFHRIKRVL